MVYEWKTPIYKISAQEAGDHIEELRKEHEDEYLPKVILDDSRPEGALLHPCFEWNDEIAAEKYRLKQAGNIIRNLNIVHVDDNQEPPKVLKLRAYVSTNNENEKANYQPIIMALSDDVTRAQVMKNAVTELKRFLDKYKGMLTLTEILDAYYRENEEGDSP